MKYAIVEIQNKQYKVTPGQTITIDRLDANEGDVINLDRVLMSVDDAKIDIGTPHLSTAKLSAKVLSHTKGEKIRVATYKSKSRYRRVKGHRSQLTQIEIIDGAAKTATKTPKTEQKASTKPAAQPAASKKKSSPDSTKSTKSKK